jgi:hypothetical protein
MTNKPTAHKKKGDHNLSEDDWDKAVDALIVAFWDGWNELVLKNTSLYGDINLSVNKLVTKLEAATEGSRELDAEVLNAVYGPTDIGPRYPNSIPEPHGDGRSAWNGDALWAPVTRSLDAAVTLVPNGMGWSIFNYKRSGQIGAFVHNSPTTVVRGYAKTVELCLCIAALKAFTEVANTSKEVVMVPREPTV